MSEKHADVCLVVPPVISEVRPFEGVSILKTCLREVGLSCHIDYANIYFYKALGEDVNRLNAINMNDAEGEYIFNGPAGVDNGLGYEDLMSFYREDYEKNSFNSDLKNRIDWFDSKVLDRAKRTAEEETARTVDRILEYSPKVVGCSNIFFQRNASIAILKRIKEQRPDIITVMGGFNCACEKGLAIMRKYDFVDYVFSGESDDVFGEVIRNAVDGIPMPMPEGVLKRGEPFPEKLSYRLVKNMDDARDPDYSDFLELLDSPFGKQMKLEERSRKGNLKISAFLESSRGCWWGEKHSCNFCSEAKCFRVKSPDRVMKELEGLRADFGEGLYCFSDLVMPIDNSELVKRLKNAEPRYSLYSEIKSNVGEETLKDLKEAGFDVLQPGIESLNDHILKLMNKGVSAVQNIAFLKNSAKYRIDPYWNLLMGTPGETVRDLSETREMIPLIEHLPAPAGISNIHYMRGCGYHTRQSEFGLDLEPDAGSRLYSPLDEDYLWDTAFIFRDRNSVGLTEELKEERKKLFDVVYSWKRASEKKILFMKDDAEIEIIDTRSCRTKGIHRLSGINAEVYRQSSNPVSMEQLCRNLSGYSEESVKKAADELMDEKLLISLSGKLLALAIEVPKATFDGYENMFILSGKL